MGNPKSSLCFMGCHFGGDPTPIGIMDPSLSPLLGDDVGIGNVGGPPIYGSGGFSIAVFGCRCGNGGVHLPNGDDVFYGVVVQLDRIMCRAKQGQASFRCEEAAVARRRLTPIGEVGRCSLDLDVTSGFFQLLCTSVGLGVQKTHVGNSII